jgi:carbonic anhydrase/acetyltransferase-like protein (isoleucine patch superfamily)
VDGGYPAIIGADVVIGHTAIVHACVLEDASMVGMKACVMDGSVVEEGAMVAAGALVTPGKHIEKGQLWAGVPAKYIRDLGPEDLAMRRDICERYMGIARDHMESLAGIGD